jgi:CspA family cold shock protein
MSFHKIFLLTLLISIGTSLLSCSNRTNKTKKIEGTVKFFNEAKGFGFITNDKTGQDILVHVTDLNGEALNEGDKVEYVEKEGNKGAVAIRVRLIHD